jgi:23S rRNA pseudouridine955/2504/2580 synthase
MFLHAWKLSLPHPITGQRLALTAPLTPELIEVLQRLNLPLPQGVGPAEPRR